MFSSYLACVSVACSTGPKVRRDIIAPNKPQSNTENQWARHSSNPQMCFQHCYCCFNIEYTYPGNPGFFLKRSNCCVYTRLPHNTRSYCVLVGKGWRKGFCSQAASDRESFQSPETWHSPRINSYYNTSQPSLIQRFS